MSADKTAGIHRREIIASAVAAACAVSAGAVGSGMVGSGASTARANTPGNLLEDNASSQPAVGDKLTANKAKVDWPMWDDAEANELLKVLNSGRWGRTSGGKTLKEFEAAFAKAMQAKHCLATSSGTTALLTTLGALGIGPGDEVVIPPYTFVATFNAITSSYALPVFVDSHIETFQIDDSKIEAAVNQNTRLLMPVHIGGSPADIDRINAIASAHKLPMIEDACQAPLASWRGRGVGTHGLGGCFSFQASKNITAGEGGAILTNDEAFAQQCLAFHTPGGARGVTSVGRGANYRLTEFQAGVLLAQLSRLEEHSKLRESNAAYLTSMLEKIPGIMPARLTDGCTRSGWHLYMFRYDAKQFRDMPRDEFLKRLAQAGVSASSGYTSLNRSAHVQALATNPHYLRIYGEQKMKSWSEQACPVNDQLCQQAVWFTQTKLLAARSEMERIAEAIAKLHS